MIDMFCSNNLLIISSYISIWIYNNFSSDTVNCLANLFQIIGQNLSSMQALEDDKKKKKK